MEYQMAAEAFGHAKNYGWDSPFKGILEDTKSRYRKLKNTIKYAS